MRWAVIAVLLSLAPAAHAQPETRPDASIAAQALFDDAKTLMDQGRYGDACPKLEESQRLEPAGGTLLHLALCYEGARRFASAWAGFKEALNVALRDGREDRARVAREHLADIEPKVSRVTVMVPAELARIEGLKVTRNQVLLGRAQWGMPVPIDAGPVIVEARAPGKRPWEKKIDVAVAASLRVDIPGLVDAATATPRPPPPPPTPERSSPSGPEPQAVAGWVLFATGLAAGVVGGALGGVAIAKKEQAEPHCDENNFCSDEAIAWQEQGVVMGNASTGLLVAGGVLAAAGLVVVLTAPKSGAANTARMPWRFSW